METSVCWLQLANSNHVAAGLLRQAGQHRSSVSRSYYSVYAAAHAVALHAGMTVDGKFAPNNWGHNRMIHVFWQSTARVGLPVARRNAYKIYFEDCRDARTKSDYVPTEPIMPELSKEVLAASQAIIEFARSVIT